MGKRFTLLVLFPGLLLTLGCGRKEKTALTAGFTVSQANGLPTLIVKFFDQSTGTVKAWQWDLDGDGDIDSVERNPTFSYLIPGTYSVSLTVIGLDAGRDPGEPSQEHLLYGGLLGANLPYRAHTEMKAGFITVWAPAVAAFSAAPTSGVLPLDVSFTDLSHGDITSWEWDFDGDGSTDSTVRNPTLTYVSPGLYTVRLTVSGPGGTDTATRTGYITVYTPAVADFTSAPVSGFAPLSVQFTDASSGDVDSWSWDFDNDGTPDSTAQNPVHTYGVHGTYSPSLTVSGPGGTDTETKTNLISAHTRPVADFTATPASGTVPLPVVFTDTSTGSVTSWSWDLDGDGTPDSTSRNPALTYTSAGWYTVKLTVSGPVGSDSVTKRRHVLVANSIWYVDTSVAASGTGTSWAQAFKTIQEGLNAAGNYDLILIADGYYSGSGNMNLDFAGKTIYLKSTGGAGMCVLNSQYSGRGFYFHSGETGDAVVDGLTVQMASPEGFRCVNSGPTITGCMISYTFGIGLYFSTSTSAIENSRISGNQSGGVYCWGSTLDFRRCEIISNQSGEGGGICANSSSVTMTNCLVAQNIRYGVKPHPGMVGGGGIAFLGNTPSDSLTLNNCSIVQNGSYDHIGNPYGNGGGLYCAAGAGAVILNNCIVWDNFAASSGHQIYTGIPVTMNYSDYASGATNVVGSVTANFCLSTDPLFVNLSPSHQFSDYHLTSASPCIDAGDDSLVPSGVTRDLDGILRIHDGNGDGTPAVDMGTYEK